ncbi:MAG: AI-2E family transporter [Planctomycetaceae bacterium]|nr:AI-2E family transporter [Planctomycetaceae bacterium]
MLAFQFEFILLQREDIRDRLIQLFGTGNLHTTTQAVTDAASRVSRYLRMNLLINACYGAGVAVGLYFIGLPNALLWGVMGMLLRFLPYLGPWIAASMPIGLSLGVFETWSATFLVLGLFVLLEVLVNNVLEPLLYGSSVGVSSLGIVIAAIFWTWLWGPVGLVLAVPLTVCLVVTGQHVPQLRFFSVLFSDRSTLSKPERLYQRLLARDADEAEKLVLDYADRNGLQHLFDQVMIPALELVELDRHGGILDEDNAGYLLELIRDLAATAADKGGAGVGLGKSEGHPTSLPVLCIPAADEADEIAASMLADLLHAEGIRADVGAVESLTSEHADRVARLEDAVVAISILPPVANRSGRYLLKRLRADHPGLPIVIGAWRSARDSVTSDPVAKDGSTYVVETLAAAVSRIRALVTRRAWQ